MKYLTTGKCVLLAVCCATALGCATNGPIGLAKFSARAPWSWGGSTDAKPLSTQPLSPPSQTQPLAYPSEPIATDITDSEKNPNIKLANFTPEPVAAEHVAFRTLGPNENLKELVQNAPGVVLIDFYADWCGPCRKQGAILHELESTASRLNATIIKVNVDQHRALATQLQVSSLPTLMLYKQGKQVERRMGVADRQTVSRLLAR